MTATLNQKQRKQLTRSATYASRTVALTLMSAKVWAWFATGSVAVLSSLVDSALDVIASAITFGAVWYALSPADGDHRFGHGKAEGLAALLQSFVIAVSGLFVCFEALHRFLEPRPVEGVSTGVGVMLGSVVLTLILVAFQRHVVKRTGSVAIAADAMHYKTDLAVNLSVALVLPLVAFTGISVLDPIVGLLIAAYILFGTWSIAKKSLEILLDKEIPDDQRMRIREIAEQHPAVHGFHDLRTRSAGAVTFVQFHLELEPKISLLETHRILDDVEDQVRDEFPNCEIIVHPDPLGVTEDRDPFDVL